MLAGYLLVAAASILWALQGVIAKALFHADVTPAVLMAVRFCVATAVLGGWMWLRRKSFRADRRAVRYFLVVGLVLGLTGFTYYYTIRATNVAIAIMLQYTGPVWVVAYEIARGVYRMSTQLGLIIALTLLSAFLLVGGYKADLLRANAVGLGVGLLSGLAFATYNVLTRRGHLRRRDPWTQTFYSFLIVALVWTVLTPAGAWPAVADYHHWGFLIYVGVFGTVVPYGCYIAGLRTLPSFPAAVVGLIEPAGAALLAALFLGEGLEPLQIVGMAGVAIAVLLLQRLTAVEVPPPE